MLPARPAAPRPRRKLVERGERIIVAGARRELVTAQLVEQEPHRRHVTVAGALSEQTKQLLAAWNRRRRISFHHRVLPDQCSEGLRTSRQAASSRQLIEALGES